MAKVSKLSTWCKMNPLTDREALYVGLDVHKKSIHAAWWLNGQLARTWVMPARVSKVLTMLKFIGLPTDQEEADRQVLRTRDQLSSKRRRVQKAIVGVARRLAIHLWRMLVTGEWYRPAT